MWGVDILRSWRSLCVHVQQIYCHVYTALVLTLPRGRRFGVFTVGRGRELTDSSLKKTTRIMWEENLKYLTCF